jgi:cyclic pyranopterin phosphate synthase
LEDRFNRRINYLRLSITDRCNLRCVYCLGDQYVPVLSHDDVLTYEELLRLSGIAMDLGISKIRITGGEPLVRRGLVDFLAKLTALPGRPEVPLTTNGVLLDRYAQGLYDAKVRRVNVSLDSLQPEKFKEITGRDYYDKVWRGIEKALEVGFNPVKINVVLMAGVNDDEVPDFVQLTRDMPISVRFIEFMPKGDNHWSPERLVTAAQVLDRLELLGELQPVPSGPLDGPARRYRLPGARGEIGIISPLTQHFCATCNRLRLTAEGILRTCLFRGEDVDLRGPMRSGASDQELIKIMRDAVARKEQKGVVLDQSNPLAMRKCQRPMSKIGG